MSVKVNKEDLKMISELSNAFGPSGFEDEVVSVAKKYADSFKLGQTEEDCLRNLYIYRNENSGNKPVFMLDAHSDEVGFMVHSIKPNGALRVVMLGGWNVGALSSNKVLVRNAEGKLIPGVFAAKPVHFMTQSEKNSQGMPSISDLIVDVGARSYDEAVNEFKLRIGEPVMADVSFEYDEEHDIMHGKGFDCRIGCAALLETMKRLKKENLNVDVVGTLSSQEEIGERGVKVSVNHVKPDIAICFEGCPADDTFTEPYAIQTALKKGPMIRFMDISVICNPRFQRFTLDLAEKNKMPIQSSVREGGGNNGAIINTALDGIPVIVIGVPVRYIHSQNCITSYYDFETTVNLAVKIVKEMNEEIIKSF